MTIRELQYAIQKAIDESPNITDEAVVRVVDGGPLAFEIFAVQETENGEIECKLGETD